MAALNDLAQLGHLVAKTHGWAAAKAFKAYSWSEQDRATIASLASRIMKVLPGTDGTHDLLSATLAFELQRTLDAPIYLVSGILGVGGQIIIGENTPPLGARPYPDDMPTWGGHLWIMAGPHIIDAAIFRLANSPDCPPVLARHVHSTFGSDKGLYADNWRKSRRIGLDYTPCHILSEEEISALLNAAYPLIANARSSAAPSNNDAS